MPSAMTEHSQANAKVQPWKAFMVFNQTSNNNTVDQEKMEGSVRLRAEADDKGTLGG
jgi:hypothetical protein